ncbi:MAG: hypothetical protein ACRDDY_01195 [Clostridium sp.]|uniref:hypothetical protein n=1 Tax=Clostridium sp. TaxID=1506 RepID=UPI003EE62420
MKELKLDGNFDFELEVINDEEDSRSCIHTGSCFGTVQTTGCGSNCATYGPACK